MKCKKCNSEWHSVRNIQSIFCPFCNAPLIDVDEEFKDLSDVLSYLVLKYGIDMLKNRNTTLQFIEVFFQAGKREYIFTSEIYSTGLMDTLFRLQNSPDVIQKSAIKQIEKQLSEKNGISMDWSVYVVSSICKAMGIANNADESIIGLIRAAERGNPLEQYKLAKCYQSGQGIERDQVQYIYWLKRAAESGNADAQFLLGTEFYYGRACEKNIRSAQMYLDKAAQSSNVDALCFILSDTELRNISTLDEKEIVNYLVKRKNELLSNQLIQLCKYYENVDFSKALELAQLSYDKDSKSAWQYYVSLLQQVGTHESEALALKVTKNIATEGNAIACLSLAQRYEERAKNENEMLTALYWYRMAADTGEVNAQIRLGEIYESGKLVKQDIENAIYWYRIAAYNGSLYAKSKVSYKSSECILKTLTLIFEDDTEVECPVIGIVSYNSDDYLIIEDPDTKERIPVKYTETETVDGFEIEQTDEKTEKIVLNKFGGGGK